MTQTYHECWKLDIIIIKLVLWLIVNIMIGILILMIYLINKTSINYKFFLNFIKY